MKITEERADEIQKTVSRSADAVKFLLFEIFIVLFIANTMWEYVKTWTW
jgi:hypothetical protein